MRIPIAPNIYIYPHDIFTGLIFLTFLANIIKTRTVKEKKLFILGCIFIAIGFTSLLINSVYLDTESFLASFGYLVRLAAYLSLIFAVKQLSENFAESLTEKLLFSGILFIFFGYIQYFFVRSLFDFYYLGWDEHRGRLFSTFLDPNFAGAFIVLICLLLFGNILINHKKKINFTRAIYLFVFILSIISLFLTHSRSAAITFFVGGLTFLLLNKMYKQIIFLSGVLIFGLIVFSNTKIEALNPFRIASSEARIHSAQEAISIFSKNPILGVGLNSYRYAKERYGPKNTNPVEIRNSDAGTDNSYIFVLATTGIIGFIVFIDFWVNIFRRIYIKTKFATISSRIVIASIVALGINTLFNNSLFYAPIMAWIFILIGATLSRKR